MNFCRDCNSDYAIAGTCNCFVMGTKRIAGDLSYLPPSHPVAQYLAGTIKDYGEMRRQNNALALAEGNLDLYNEAQWALYGVLTDDQIRPSVERAWRRALEVNQGDTQGAYTTMTNSIKGPLVPRAAAILATIAVAIQ